MCQTFALKCREYSVARKGARVGVEPLERWPLVRHLGRHEHAQERAVEPHAAGRCGEVEAQHRCKGLQYEYWLVLVQN